MLTTSSGNRADVPGKIVTWFRSRRTSALDLYSLNASINPSAVSHQRETPFSKRHSIVYTDGGLPRVLVRAR